MSAYKCQLCYLSFTLKEEHLYEKYLCGCGRNVCGACIVHFMEHFKCAICSGFPAKALDPDYDCFCEACGDYNRDGYGLAIDKNGLKCYMCSCCINGCYKHNDDEACQCLEISLAACSVKQ